MAVVYTVMYHEQVHVEDIRRLSQTTKRQIRKAIEQKLTTHPEMYGKPLRGSAKGYWKLRVGKYRIVYTIQKRTVMVLIVAHRKHVYQRGEKRI